MLSIPFGVAEMDERGDRDEEIESKLEHLEVWATVRRFIYRIRFRIDLPLSDVRVMERAWIIG